MDPGLVGHALRSRGFAFTEFHRETPGEWPALEGFDLVLGLGSSWSTYWPQFRAQTGAERGLLAEAHRSGVPVLGICFGGQQLSVALGGTVERSQMHEVGWHRVDTLPETTVPGAETLAGEWFQWHYDRFSVPSGTTALAASPASPQAFLAGRSLGLQFHPEVTESIVAQWSSGDGAGELAAAGIDRDALLAETASRQPDVSPRTDALVGWFLERAGRTSQAHENQG